MTATSPPKLAPAEIESTFSLEVAVSMTLPLALIASPAPIEAVVVLVQHLHVDAGADAGVAADREDACRVERGRLVGGRDGDFLVWRAPSSVQERRRS